MNHTHSRSSSLGFVPTHLITAIFLLLMGSQALGIGADKCPKAGDHSLSAVHYQLFASYQTSFDGYEMPCSMQCFDKTQCMHRCQSKKANAALAKQFSKLLNEKQLSHCQSYTQVCLKQCDADDPGCQKACQGTNG